MSDQGLIDDLIEEVEETLETEGLVGLYDFSWSLRGLRRGVPESDIPDICLEAYRIFRTRHDLELVWMTWPPELSAATPAAADTPLEFDIERDKRVDTPALFLIPRSAV